MIRGCVNSTRNCFLDLVESQGLELLTPDSPTSQLLNWDWLMATVVSMSCRLHFVSTPFLLCSSLLFSVQVHHWVWKGTVVIKAPVSWSQVSLLRDRSEPCDPHLDSQWFLTCKKASYHWTFFQYYYLRSLPHI